ncbi:MAG: diguanylate cyclase [Gammaproteobacteria bacterium]|nr:diguanylate cyclase [Gammaproteobacteria bacterium]MDH5801153.1 diguanylate cyclase [Gammaproteobacteria bacterium]
MASATLELEAPKSLKQARSKILIVDDSATIRATLTRAVKNEFTAIEATDGVAAWDLIENDPKIELVVTDLSMPELDGYGLINRIRGSDISRIQNMPVIVVTGANDTEARERAFVEGANDFITKTSDQVELLARVRAHQKLAQTISALEESRKFLREQANTDSLTRLPNRRNFFRSAAYALAQMQRRSQDFSVIMLDIDYFKQINDTYGHQTGDYVLVELAKVLSMAIREDDMLARIGGEEFVVASPVTNRLAAIVLAERLRKAVESTEFRCQGNRIPVTISLGLASLSNPEETVDSLMAIADARLYLAKQKGRNRICASDKTKPDVLADSEVCPKLDEALTLIRHGNAFRLEPFLPELGEQIMPLIDLLSRAYPDLDAQGIRRSLGLVDPTEE